MFDPAVIPDAGDRARILAVSPLIREMMLYALRWPIDRGARAAEEDRVSDAFFLTLADLVSEALDHEAPLSLPTSEDPVVAAAMTYTKDHLAVGQPRRGEPGRRGLGAHTAAPVPERGSDCPGGRTCCMPGCCGRWRCSPPPVRSVQQTRQRRRLRQHQLVHPRVRPVLRRDAVVIPATSQQNRRLRSGPGGPLSRASAVAGSTDRGAPRIPSTADRAAGAVDADVLVP